MPDYCGCRVLAAGPGHHGIYLPQAPPNILIRLAGPPGTFPETWFLAEKQSTKEMLAAALAAITTGLPVSITVQSTDEYSVLQALFLTVGE